MIIGLERLSRIDYVCRLAQLSRIQRLTFYESLAHNLTVCIRVQWSESSLSDSDKVARIKWLNEILHRVTAIIQVIRTESHDWTDNDMWMMIQDMTRQSPSISSTVGDAIESSLVQAVK